MELRHLRYFVTVAELLNFTAAARRLHVAQPALSRQIQDLEEELGTELLDRRARPIRLTEPGQAFVEEARAVLERAQQAAETARAAARGERGEIHVGYAPTPTIELLPSALHAFQNVAPDVKVSLHDLSTQEMLCGLQQGRLHLCLMVLPPAPILGCLRFELLREYPLCAALQPGHALAKRRTLSREELTALPLLAYPRSQYPDYHELVERVFEGLTSKPKLLEDYDSGSGIMAAVESGRGWMLAPSCMAAQVGQRLQLRPIEPAPPQLKVGALYEPGRAHKAANRFLAALRSLKAPRQGGF